MDRVQLLDSILKLTVKMRTAAEQDEWEAVAEQESERLQLIQEFFSEPVSESDSEQVKQALHRIIDTDKEIMSKAEDAKKVIHSEVKQLSVEKRAFEEYAKNR